MATGYDGTVKIDTSINSKGFNTGVKSMMASVVRLGAAIGVAFGIGAVVNFGRTAVQEASNMASAMIGLQSIVEGTGGSFRGAQEFINQFTSDGLVPAANAITAYKNLLLRGYDTSQIEGTLTALKDSAAFGRSAHLTLGEAVQTATEGLKNENSILVDNAGVTKNISILWKEYADSIGTTVGALTKQQKIQAEVNGILNESRFQVGDSAKLAGTYAGQVSALGVSMLNLRIAVGNAIIPIIQKIMPYIRAAVDALTFFFNRVALIVGLLFGVQIGAQADATTSAMGGAAEATNEAAAAQEGLGNSTEKAGKKAKGALAAFDQLNVLQQPTDTAGGAGAGAGDLAGIGGAPLMPEIDTSLLDDGLDDMREKVSQWKEDFLAFIEPVRAAFGRLLDALTPLGQTIWSGLQWAWENILKPLGIWAAQSLVPAVFDLLAGAVTILNDVLTGLQPMGQWLWENFLKPLGEWAGATLIAAIQQITEWLQQLHEWIGKNQETWQSLVWILGIVAAVTLLVIAPISATTLAIAALVAAIIWLIAHWKEIGPAFANTWKIVTDNTMTALNFVKGLFSSVWNGIVGIVKSAINSIIEFINRMVSGIASGINVLAAIGGAFGIGIPSVAAPQIPYLASGAVIPPNAEFAAVLGDQRAGRNLEAPEGLIRQIIREEMGSIRGEFTFAFDGSLGELVRLLKPRLDRENIRIGNSLAKGTA